MIYVDGRRVEATAVLYTTYLGETAHQAVRLEMPEADRVEIVALVFEEGRFVPHATDAALDVTLSYLPAGDRAPLYMARSGTLEIGVAGDAVLEGSFSFETVDLLSSCAECDDAKGPTVQGRFHAVRAPE